MGPHVCWESGRPLRCAGSLRPHPRTPQQHPLHALHGGRAHDDLPRPHPEVSGVRAIFHHTPFARRSVTTRSIKCRHAAVPAASILANVQREDQGECELLQPFHKAPAFAEESRSVPFVLLAPTPLSSHCLRRSLFSTARLTPACPSRTTRWAARRRRRALARASCVNECLTPLLATRVRTPLPIDRQWWTSSMGYPVKTPWSAWTASDGSTGGYVTEVRARGARAVTARWIATELEGGL